MESPAQWQPQLARWQHGWRLVAMVLFSLLVGSATASELPSDHRWLWITADAALGVTSLVLVHLRRRWPLAVALTISVFSMVSGFSAGPWVLAMVSVATRRRWPEVMSVGAAAVVSSVVDSEIVTGRTSRDVWLELIAGVVVIAAVLGWGMYIGSRRELLWTLRQRAERAESEQALRAAQAKITERTRIAREMHDVLAHRMSQIAMQSGALSYREDLDHAELRRGVRDIQHQAHRALTDLRSVLGVLRNPESGEPQDRPQPTYGELALLMEDCRAAGGNIEFVDTVTAPVPETLGRTVYRIVQESLTNAAKHAPHAKVSVTVSGGPSCGIDFSVSNPLPLRPNPPSPPGAGLGLVGLAERAELAGGRFSAGRSGDTFSVQGWLPWRGEAV